MLTVIGFMDCARTWELSALCVQTLSASLVSQGDIHQATRLFDHILTGTQIHSSHCPCCCCFGLCWLLEGCSQGESNVSGFNLAYLDICLAYQAHAHLNNQISGILTHSSVWRSTVILTLAMVYLMWAITYLAQLHPLVQPRRSDLRPEFAEAKF